MTLMRLSFLILLFSLAACSSDSNRIKKQVNDILRSKINKPSEWGKVMDEIEKIGEPAIPYLIQDLNEGDVILWELAALSLGRIGEPAISQVAELLSSPSTSSRKRALVALSYIGKNSATPASIIANSLSDNDEEVRSQAAKGLGTMALFANSALPALINAYSREQSVRAKGVMIEALGSTSGSDGPIVLNLLVENMKSPEYMIRVSVMTGLGELAKSYEPAMRPLKEGFNDENIVVRAAAIWGIVASERYSVENVALIQNAQKDKDPKVRDSADSAMIILALRLKKALHLSKAGGGSRVTLR